MVSGGPLASRGLGSRAADSGRRASPMFVYILRSQRTGRYYVGSTQDLSRRLAEHNQPEENPSRWTRGGAPWKLVFSEDFLRATQAVRAEKFIKRMKSRDFIEKLVRGERTLEAFKR